MKKGKKITILGAGNVGATIAYTLAMDGMASEIVLIDINEKKAQGEAMDILQGTPFCAPVSIYAGNYSDAVGSDVVVIACGVARKPGQSRLDLAQTNVDIIKLLSQLLEESYPSFAEAGISYELRSNVDSLEITADGGLIARVFENLIGNAIKYGAEGKRVIVRVSAEPANDAVEVKVINFGYVIPEKDLPFIFDKFYRVDQSRSTKTGGTGLGLAIAKEIVDMHGGSIGVTSDLSGTVFTVRLKIHFDKEIENLKRA